VISHKANRLKSNFTPEELRTFCEAVFEVDWVTWNKDDERRLREEGLRYREALKQKDKERWWKICTTSRSPRKPLFPTSRKRCVIPPLDSRLKLTPR
jgi:hypothetical protein